MEAGLRICSICRQDRKLKKYLSKRVRVFTQSASYLYEPFEANKKLFRQGIKITKLESCAEREVRQRRHTRNPFNNLNFSSKCVKCDCNLMKIEVTWKLLLERCTCLIHFNRSLIVHFAVDCNMICIDRDFRSAVDQKRENSNRKCEGNEGKMWQQITWFFFVGLVRRLGYVFAIWNGWEVEEKLVFLRDNMRSTPNVHFILFTFSNFISPLQI